MDSNSIVNSIQEIMKTFESNPIIPLIASGGLTVWVISNLKTIYYAVKNFIMSLISFNIHNAYEDTRGFGYNTKRVQLIFNDFLNGSKTLWERNIQLDLDNLRRVFDNSESRVKEEAMIINNTYGFSIKILFGKLVFCTRSQRADNNKLMTNVDLQVFFARKKKFLEKIQNYIDQEYIKEENKFKNRDYLEVLYGNGQNCSNKQLRSLDSIFTNNDEHIDLYNEIRKFIDNKEIYSKMNYPYKMSILLHGVPGCGKSSSILAVASKLNRDIEYVNLATTNVSQLMDRININTNGKIFVFEDIDALNSNSFAERDASKSEDGKSAVPPTNQPCVINNGSDGIKVFTLSLSDLLNITDGLLSSDGAICIFTTNHIEKLDAALLRAGRMNKIIKFEYLNSDTANRMIEYHLGHKIDNLKDEIKPAELQEDILNILLRRCNEDILRKYQK